MAMSDDHKRSRPARSRSKYGRIGSRLQHAADHDVPFISDHAHDRWDERMPADAVAPETALEHGTRETDIIHLPHYEQHEEGPPDALWLFYETTRTASEKYYAVLIERHGAITTAFRMAGIRYPPLKAYLRTVANMEVDNV